MIRDSLIFSVKPSIEPDANGFYLIGDMYLNKAQYQKAYGNVASSGINGINFRWENGGTYHLILLLK